LKTVSLSRDKTTIRIPKPVWVMVRNKDRGTDKIGERVEDLEPAEEKGADRSVEEALAEARETVVVDGHDLASSGKKVKEIGDELSLSVKTIGTIKRRRTFYHER